MKNLRWKTGYYVIKGPPLSGHVFLWKRSKYSDPVEHALKLIENELRVIAKTEHQMRIQGINPNLRPLIFDNFAIDNPVPKPFFEEHEIIEYLGKNFSYSPLYRLKTTKSELIRSYLKCLKKAQLWGDPRVRIPNRGDGETPIFSEAVQFPRWRKNGELWSSENNYLSCDEEFATEQMQAAGFAQ